MSIRYSAPGVPGGEVSPGSGSTGFSSNAVAFTNSSGQLTASTGLQFTDHATSAIFRVASTANPSTAVASGALIVGPTTTPNLGIGPDRLQARSSASAASNLNLNPGGGNVQIGSSNISGLFTLLSTVNVTTGVGAAGGAAAVPATPEVYVKLRIPNSGHTLTTLYIPCYLSTG